MNRFGVALLTCAFFATVSPAGDETFNLKYNMNKINVELDQARAGMIRNEIGLALKSLGVVIPWKIEEIVIASD